MKRKMLRLIAAITVMMMLIVSVACGSAKQSNTVPGGQSTGQSSGTEQSSSTEQTKLDPVKLTYIGGADLLPGNNVQNFIEKKFNVTFSKVEGGGDNNVLSLMLVSGDYPDIIISDKNAGGMFAKYADGGHLVALDEYIDKSAPNLKNAISKYLPIYKNPKDGKLYFIPSRYDQAPYLDNGFIMRYDLWDSVGKPEIKTNDDLTKVAKLMKEKTPTVNGKKAYPFAFFLGESWGDQWLDKVFIAAMGQTMYGNINFAPDGKALKVNDFMYMTKEYHDGMKWVNMLYREGLADPESAVMKCADYVQKMNDGRTFFGITTWDVGGVNAALAKAGHPEQKIEPVFLKWSGYEGNTFYANKWGAGSSNVLWVTKKAKDEPEKLDRIIQIADYAASDEGKQVIWWGPQDETWTMQDNKMVLKSDILNTVKTDSKWREKLGISNAFFTAFGAAGNFTTTGQMLDFSSDPEFLSANYDENEKKIIAELGYKSFEEPFIKDYIGAECTALSSAIILPDNSEEIAIKTKADILCHTATAQLFLAKSEAEFEKLYNKYASELKTMQYDKFMKVYTENMDKIQKEMGLK